MNSAVFMEYTVKSMMIMMLISLPPIICAAVIGVVMGLIQAVTQIQEQTIQFGIKLSVITLVLILLARWGGGQLLGFTQNIFELFPVLVR